MSLFAKILAGFAFVGMALWITFLSGHESAKVTVRNIEGPTGIYTIPYSTHGGTVYVSSGEQHRMWFEEGGLDFLGLIMCVAVYLNYRSARSKK